MKMCTVQPTQHRITKQLHTKFLVVLESPIFNHISWCQNTLKIKFIRMRVVQAQLQKIIVTVTSRILGAVGVKLTEKIELALSKVKESISSQPIAVFRWRLVRRKFLKELESVKEFECVRNWNPIPYAVWFT